MLEIQPTLDATKVPQELQAALVSLVQKYEREDQSVRQQQLRQWKKNDLYWHGIQHIFWSEVNQDWINPAAPGFKNDSGQDTVYDFSINIYRAHGESVIAALSAQTPTVRFPPDDADDEDDLLTSKTFSKIADLVQKHNQSKLLLMQALFTLWNQGLVAAYLSPKTSEDYGMVQIPEYEAQLACPVCGFMTEGGDQGLPVDEFTGSSPCPKCGSPMESRQTISNIKEFPKCRTIIELYGPINAKVSHRAVTQKDCGYIILNQDKPHALLKSLFKDVKLSGSSSSDAEEAETRASSLYGDGAGEYESSPLKRCWLRPWTYNDCEESLADKLRKQFPKGCYVALVGDSFAEARAESMDDFWILGKCGLSRFIHSDPIGKPLISVQELRNQLLNLTEETIEHSIPSGFADPRVLNFDEYAKQPARPGDVYPAKPREGHSLGESFYESGRSNLSKEVGAFANQLDQDGQFVVGSFPSIYGGPSEGSSRTASEYSQSRQMALQRLSITLTMLNYWWANVLDKSVRLFLATMVADEERFVESKNGSYVNVFIRRAEAQGKVGNVEPESVDNFPMTLAQKQTLVLDLMKMGNDFIEAALFDPENRKLLANWFGLLELEIPGEAQRVKQARETQQMLKGAMVEVDSLVDEHELHIHSLTSFMVSEEGQLVMRENPEAYMMLREHLSMHKELQAQQQMAEALAAVGPEGQPKSEAPVEA
jgi:hypothetical protein